MIKCPEASLYPRIVRGWELGPFEGPPTLKPPALPGDTYLNAVSTWRLKRAISFWTRLRGQGPLVRSPTRWGVAGSWSNSGEHAVTHIVPRLKKVIAGEDKAGATEATGWKGGGGFRFYRLPPSLLATDKWGNWVISKTYNAAMLAEAICKLMGFVYAPSQDPAEYWRHGHSSERDFLYVTTASLTHEQLRSISKDVGPERTLLICCKAFNARASDFENLTVKKIPHAVLSRCEWGKDDYSLRIAALPEREAETTPAPDPAPAPRKRRVRDDQPTFFDNGEA